MNLEGHKAVRSSLDLWRAMLNSCSFLLWSTNSREENAEGFLGKCGEAFSKALRADILINQTEQARLN